MLSTNSKYFIGERSLVSNNNLHIDQSAQTITAISYKVPVKKIKKSQTLIKRFCQKITKIRKRRMRFTGKGYKIKKSKVSKNYRFFFGRSHKSFIFNGGMVSKKQAKQKIIIASNNNKKLNKVAMLLVSVRSTNAYTKRGLRKSKQFILKRPGKKSTY